MQIIGLDCDIINDFPEGNATFFDSDHASGRLADAGHS